MQKFTIVLVLLISVVFTKGVNAGNFELNSPDGKIKLIVETADKIQFSVFYNNIELCSASGISMSLKNGQILGENSHIKKAFTRKVDETIIPVVKEKRSIVEDNYNELVINFKGNYSLNFRVYNDGVAYRFSTNFKKDITVKDEEVIFTFAENDSIYFPEEESFFTHSERLYSYLSVKEIDTSMMCCVPALVCKPGGIRVAITESGLLDYPGLYLTGTNTEESVLKVKFPKYPLTEKKLSDRDFKVTERKDYLAVTAGKRNFPWRILIITDNDGGLIESDIVYRLASPNRLADFFWIEPGKVAWDWWNALNIYNVDFKSGINTDTYKYYIDFASKYGIEYIILDEGWSDTEDLLSVNPDIDMEELMAYAEKKDVGVILWVVWLTLDRQMEEALNRFEKWGVKGIKVDFMQRDDQKMVNYYEKVAAEAAKRKMIVDFHGAYKPAGLRRTYPNVLTREGVKGLENSKWSYAITPEHDLILPFTRMLAGPMDYTPGAMLNAGKNHFFPVFSRPMSQGTRCHQLAMYVVYESPLQMLSDSPSNYYKEPETMEFLSQVPVEWDDTKVLKAKVGDYVIIARKNGDDWYIGGMTDWQPREFSIDLWFLEDGKYKLFAWEDGINAENNAVDFKVTEKDITKNDSITIKMAPGGGYAGIIKKIEK